MTLVNTNYRESTQTQSWYDSVFRSLYDAELKPQTFGELIYRYGGGLSVLNFLHLAGKTMGVKSPNITIFEKGAPTRPVTVSVPTATAPISVTVTPSAADNSDDYLREKFDLVIPAAYTNRDVDVPLRLTYSGGTWTGKAYDVGATIDTALSDEICFIGASSMGRGDNGVEPMATGTYTRTTADRMMREAAGLEGGVVYQEEWEEIAMKDGSKGLWTRSIGEMDFRLSDQMDTALLLSQANTNTSNLTATSISGSTSAIPSFDGLMPTMKSLAQELPWTSNFDIDKFRAVKVLLENVGIVNRTVDFMVGTDLMANIETSMIDFLKTNSAGHSFYNELNSVGFNVKDITINSVKFYLSELSSFSNPQKLGLSSYGYRNTGFILPQGEYSATLSMAGENQELRLPHLTLGYPEGNGENRQRIVSVEPGVNGLQGMGGVVSNAYDGVKFHTLAHMIPIFNHMYQTILVQKDTSAGGGA